MALSIVRNDITRMKVDAIVNSTNERLIPGGFGVDASVHYAAGPALAVALNKIGRCPTGSCVMTDAFEIPTCRFIIHAVGPVYGPPGGPETAETGQDGYALIEACYRSIYRLASEHGCRSVAVPLISAGANGFPTAEVYRIATSTARAFLLSRKADEDMRIFIVLYDEESIGVSRKVSDEIRHYISDEYRAEHVRELQSCMYLRSPGAGGLNRKPRSVSVLQDMSLSYGTECQAGDEEDYRAMDKSFPEMCEW